MTKHTHLSSDFLYIMCERILKRDSVRYTLPIAVFLTLLTSWCIRDYDVPVLDCTCPSDFVTCTIVVFRYCDIFTYLVSTNLEIGKERKNEWIISGVCVWNNLL